MNALEIEDETERADALKHLAIEFVPTLESRADEAEALRRLPPETFADFKALGFSRLCQPRKFGGAELPLDRAVDIIATLARGCGSSAWVTAVYTDHSILTGMFAEQANQDIWGASPEAALSAGYQPAGEVERVTDGWRLAGKWGWVSGCDYADWFLLGTLIPDDEGGVIHHFLMVPRRDIEIEDNWHVMGLKGTGSKNVIVKESIVPDHRVLSLPLVNGGESARQKGESRPLYRLGHVATVPFVFSGVALGIAESLLDALTAQISARESRGTQLASLPTMQVSIAESAAEIDCARLLVMRDTETAMATMRQGRALSLDERARNRRDHAYVARLCKSAVDRLHGMVGARAIFDGHVAERKFRDLHAVVGHMSMSWDISGITFGEVAFGLEPSLPYI